MNTNTNSFAIQNPSFAEQLAGTITMYKLIDGEVVTKDTDEDDDVVAALEKKGWSKTNPKAETPKPAPGRGQRSTNRRKDVPATRQQAIAGSRKNQEGSVRVPQPFQDDFAAGFPVIFTFKVIEDIQVQQTDANDYYKTKVTGDYTPQSGDNKGKPETMTFCILFNEKMPVAGGIGKGTLSLDDRSGFYNWSL